MQALKKRSSQRIGVSRVAEWRLGRLIHLIAAGTYPNCRSLAREIEVSEKTIQRDLNHLRDQKGLPLEYHPERHGYYFTAPVGSLAPIRLSRGELVALFVAQKALEPLRGTKLQRLVAESLQKIAAACPESVTLHWEDLDAAYSVKATGVVAADAVLFARLIEAVMNHKELAFTYQKLAGAAKEQRRVQPYHVGHLQNGWYLIAHDLDRKEMRKFALQRVTDLEVHAKRFERPKSFSMNDYLSSGFGVWGYGAEAERHEVRLRFTGWAAQVVSERLWHPSQRITNLNDDGSEIEFCAVVAGLEEITRWVLSWGGKVHVLGPEILRKRVLQEVEALRRNLMASSA